MRQFITQKILTLLLACAIAVVSVSVKADVTVSLYQELKANKQPEVKQLLQLFFEATYTAMQTMAVRYHADGYPMAFCPPEHKTFTVEDLYNFVDSEIAAAKAIRHVPYEGHEPISFVMINALQIIFPCENYKPQ